MGKPVARGARLIAVGVALVGVSASLLVVPVNALDSISVDRAELDDGLLRVEGEGAVPERHRVGHLRGVVGKQPPPITRAGSGYWPPTSGRATAR